MAWIKDEIGRAVGLPAAFGGIPLDELGATGWGLAHATEVAARHCDLRLDGARMAIQGYGSVGKHAARFLAQKGAVLVAASDSRGTIVNAHGLDVFALSRHKDAGNPVATYPEGRAQPADAIIEIDCDIWIPAARPDVIHETNAHRLRTRLVPEGANIPITPRAETMLAERGVLVVPDFIANAGGVICAAMEYAGATQAAAFQAIQERIVANTEIVLTAAKSKHLSPRAAAVELATARVREAMALRRFGIF